MLTKALAYLIGGIIALAMLPAVATHLVSAVGPMVVQGLTIVTAAAIVVAVVWFVVAATRDRQLGRRRPRTMRDPWRF